MMKLGPPYKHQGRWWQNVLEYTTSDTRPQGHQTWYDWEGWCSCTITGTFYPGCTYRIPAKPHQMAPDATPVSAPALPITLTADSPEPPVGSVVVVRQTSGGSWQESHRPWAWQRSYLDSGWNSAYFGSGQTWEQLLAAFPGSVLLVYVPPETK